MADLNAELGARLINAQAIFAPDWGKPCECPPTPDWDEGCECGWAVALQRLTTPDGHEYVVPWRSWIMLRSDRLDLTGVTGYADQSDSTWGYWSFDLMPAPSNIAHLLVKTKPAAVPSDCRFRRAAVEALYAVGASIWPCDLVLDHAPLPPHVVMYGEDLIGWIMPVKEGSEGDYVHLPQPGRPRYAMSLPLGAPS